MNLSKKYTYPLFESIAVHDGVIQHEQWHQKRFIKSYQGVYNCSPNHSLLEGVEVPEVYRVGHVKLRISYNQDESFVEFQNYEPKQIQSLRLVDGDELNYQFKFQDRTTLNKLFEQRKTCDDILIVKNKLITDSSYANIVFYDGEHWLTPKLPLLDGTARARLLSEGLIKEAEITVSDLASYGAFKLINAMRDFEKVKEGKVKDIIA